MKRAKVQIPDSITVTAKFVELDASNDGLLRIGLECDAGSLGRRVARFLFEDCSITFSGGKKSG